jgi:glycopeptide antibiotics resistance protein
LSIREKDRKKRRIIGKILFVLYIVFLIWFLIFSDWYGRTGKPIFSSLHWFADIPEGRHYNLELFKEIKRFWNNRQTLGYYSLITNVVGNVLIFVPFGFFLPMASKRKSFLTTVFLGFGLSLLVEIFQLVTAVGSFDVDDLFLNTVGVVVGFVIYEIGYLIKHHNKRR